MKPISDDVVFSILEGLEKREKRKRALPRPRRAAMPDTIHTALGTSRTISLSSAGRRAKRTVSDLYCYIAGSSN